MTTAMQQARLGDHVTFRDHTGLPKAAIVTGTIDTIDPKRAARDGQVPAIDNREEVHLTVFPPTGGMEARYNVRPGDQPGQWESGNGSGRGAPGGSRN